jgi:hypothetical protein
MIRLMPCSVEKEKAAEQNTIPDEFLYGRGMRRRPNQSILMDIPDDPQDGMLMSHVKVSH